MYFRSRSVVASNRSCRAGISCRPKWHQVHFYTHIHTYIAIHTDVLVCKIALNALLAAAPLPRHLLPLPICIPTANVSRVPATPELLAITSRCSTNTTKTKNNNNYQELVTASSRRRLKYQQQIHGTAHNKWPSNSRAAARAKRRSVKTVRRSGRGVYNNRYMCVWYMYVCWVVGQGATRCTYTVACKLSYVLVLGIPTQRWVGGIMYTFGKYFVCVRLKLRILCSTSYFLFTY